MASCTPAACSAIQSLGVLLGVVGLALGFVIAGGWGGRFTVHRNLGLAATILGLAQVGVRGGACAAAQCCHHCRAHQCATSHAECACL
jgi:hypothetical protein